MIYWNYAPMEWYWQNRSWRITPDKNQEGMKVDSYGICMIVSSSMPIKQPLEDIHSGNE
jgi:hypothetical protein